MNIVQLTGTRLSSSVDTVYNLLNPGGFITDAFDGIQLSFQPPPVWSSISSAFIDTGKTGWVVGNSPIRIITSNTYAKYFPWQYDIVWTDSLYKTRVNGNVPTTGISDSIGTYGESITLSKTLTNASFPFYVVNKSFPDANGNFEKLDLVVADVNRNSVYDPGTDYIIASHLTKIGNRYYFLAPVFRIDFNGVPQNQMPKSGDIFRLTFVRPWSDKDSLVFTVTPGANVVSSEIEQGMEKINVVPNPYIVTNMMEPYISNSGFNQRRQLLFTHLPAQCVIKIFTSSGVFIREIDVNNAPDNGTVHWDMLTKENLEIAAGIYVYHVKSSVTGKEKIGKFAVIK
jgi:hypothetical protein